MNLDINKALENAFASFNIDITEESAQKVLNQIVLKEVSRLKDDTDAKILLMDEKLFDNISIPNAKSNEDYLVVIDKSDVDEVESIEVSGLEGSGINVDVDSDNPKKVTLSGKVKRTKTVQKYLVSVKITLKNDFFTPFDVKSRTKEYNICVNPNSWDLWKEIDPDPNTIYIKPNRDSALTTVNVGEDRFNIISASVRGRSHAHSGICRDDDFKSETLENGWIIMVVCDGAGSCKYSREGARIFSNSMVNEIKASLSNDDSLSDYDKLIKDILLYKDDKETQQSACINLKSELYKVLPTASFKSMHAVKAEVSNRATVEPDVKLKDYSTTVLSVICRKFGEKWLVASFSIGDGAIGLYNAVENGEAKDCLMNTPDEGEFAGQTRFATMQELYTKAEDIMDRINFAIVDSFESVMLMTDGVSDPMFESDENLKSQDKWNVFWSDLKASGLTESEDKCRQMYEDMMKEIEDEEISSTNTNIQSDENISADTEETNSAAAETENPTETEEPATQVSENNNTEETLAIPEVIDINEKPTEGTKTTEIENTQSSSSVSVPQRSYKEEMLLEWLMFKKEGNHDDRTITVFYKDK